MGEKNASLLCMTNLTACCQQPDTGEKLSVPGNWFFPNKTWVPSGSRNWDFYRGRPEMGVRLSHRRRGGVEGIYWCSYEMPVSMNVTQIMYIGLYNTNIGKVLVILEFRVWVWVSSSTWDLRSVWHLCSLSSSLRFKWVPVGMHVLWTYLQLRVSSSSWHVLWTYLQLRVSSSSWHVLWTYLQLRVSSSIWHVLWTYNWEFLVPVGMCCELITESFWF